MARSTVRLTPMRVCSTISLYTRPLHDHLLLTVVQMRGLAGSDVCVTQPYANPLLLDVSGIDIHQVTVLPILTVGCVVPYNGKMTLPSCISIHIWMKTRPFILVDNLSGSKTMPMTNR